MGTWSLRARGFRVLGRAEGVGKAGIRSTQTFVSGNPITKSSPSLNSSKNAQGSSMPTSNPCPIKWRYLILGSL